jgi:hypothetical protein
VGFFLFETKIVKQNNEKKLFLEGETKHLKLSQFFLLKRKKFSPLVSLRSENNFEEAKRKI